MNFVPTFTFGPWTTLFCCFAFVAAIQLVYVFFIYARMAFYKRQESPETTALPPISIIIAARNESDNLYDNLPSILCQDYPEFEVIVVNNQSIDDSSWILTAFARQFPNLRVVELSKNPHIRLGKKLPITLAVKAAKYDHFLLTDADCKPHSNQWIRKMASHYSRSKQIVIGYSPYTRVKGFLNRLIRFDNAWTGVNYNAMALADLPYKAVGRNLAYTKDVFHSVNGFRSHYALTPGDDDLFIQEAAKRKNYSIQLDPDSFCSSPAADSWSGWIRQKAKHYATSARYRFIKKLLLGIYPLSLILMWFCFLPLLFNRDFALFGASIFAVVLLIKWWFQGRCLYQLKETSFVRFFPFWDLFYSLLLPVLYYISERQKYYRW
ncbi:MAG: hypothetical protein RLZZ301_562 [Bacteroidota bacterium]|jgi:glycosyltransferase involved in cell wall biosynthesis